MIIVPIPSSHQEDNAKYFEKKNAAVVLNQKELTGDMLTATVVKLFDERGMLKIMGKHAREFAKTNATELVAKEVVALAKK